MPFDWYAFLQLAHFLHRQPSGISMEADQRTVVSRSYYAAFGFVRDYARDHLGFQPRDEATDHGSLRARLRRGKTQVIAERLEDLRHWRNACDYSADLPFDPALTAENALEWADRIFQSLGHRPTSQ
jgi:hypothetical protein